MRIAHFLQGRCNPDSANGVDKTAFFLSSAQAELGHSVAIFSISDKPAIPVPGVETRCYKRTALPFVVPDSLIRELRSWQPSLVHLHSAYVPLNIALARSLCRDGIPYVVTPNGGLSSALVRRKAYLKLPYKYVMERPFLNRAAFVHAVGDGTEIRKYGVTAPVVFAPNGFNLSTIPAALSGDIIRSRFPQTAGSKVVLFLGRLNVRQKGLDLLLSSFAEAVKTAPELFLVLVGPDWNGGRQRLESLARHLEMHDKVIFWGPAFGRDKFELLASADIFAHTSRWEGLPFALIEALAIGKTCIVTPAADPLGLVARSGAGTVSDSDVPALAEALGTLGRFSRSELDDKGRAGRRLVEEELNWERIAETLASAYARYCLAN